MKKLFTIGDSISQGFMSLAAARTDLSFSTLIAERMKIQGYSIPSWPAGGLPINLEDVFRKVYRKHGSNVKGLEWAFALNTINNVIDKSEDYYEREGGRESIPYPGGAKHFDNVSVRGFDIADAWLLNASICQEQIQKTKKRFFNDGYLSSANASLYRTALQVLNPSRKDQFNSYTQLDWLAHHHEQEGVENLVLWLGANNALGTIINLDVNQTPRDVAPHNMTHQERADAGWNLWDPLHFQLEYEVLIDRVVKIMEDNPHKADWQVFIGNIPLITIAPLIKGVGSKRKIQRDGRECTYYKYYTYVPFEYEFAFKGEKKLTADQAIHIDDCIRAYNKSIEAIIAAANKKLDKKRFHLIDVAGTLNDLALKRNDYAPVYEFPEYFDFLYPKPNTKYYHATPNGVLEQGGLFSLDGVHPSAIGQGIIAREFCKVMDKVRNTKYEQELDWQAIFDSDSLYSSPIPLMTEIYQHEDLANLYTNFSKWMRD